MVRFAHGMQIYQHCIMGFEIMPHIDEADRKKGRTSCKKAIAKTCHYA